MYKSKAAVYHIVYSIYIVWKLGLVEQFMNRLGVDSITIFRRCSIYYFISITELKLYA